MLEDKTHNTYTRRNETLEELGYNSYQDYLNSDLWAKIRKRAYKKYGRQCILCTEKATEIHHIGYGKPVLLGISLEQLAPLCRECHDNVECERDGTKRSLVNAQSVYAACLKKVKEKPIIPTCERCGRKGRSSDKLCKCVAAELVGKVDKRYARKIARKKGIKVVKEKQTAQITTVVIVPSVHCVVCNQIARRGRNLCRKCDKCVRCGGIPRKGTRYCRKCELKLPVEVKSVVVDDLIVVLPAKTHQLHIPCAAGCKRAAQKGETLCVKCLKDRKCKCGKIPKTGKRYCKNCKAEVLATKREVRTPLTQEGLRRGNSKL